MTAHLTVLFPRPNRVERDRDATSRFCNRSPVSSPAGVSASRFYFPDPVARVSRRGGGIAVGVIGVTRVSTAILGVRIGVLAHELQLALRTDRIGAGEIAIIEVDRKRREVAIGRADGLLL